jgi:hypothetical protein
MSTTLFFQTITQFRVDFDDEGKPVGSPKYIKGFTTPMYGTRKPIKSKVREIKAVVGEQVEI